MMARAIRVRAYSRPLRSSASDTTPGSPPVTVASVSTTTSLRSRATHPSGVPTRTMPSRESERLDAQSDSSDGIRVPSSARKGRSSNRTTPLAVASQTNPNDPPPRPTARGGQRRGRRRPSGAGDTGDHATHSCVTPACPDASRGRGPGRSSSSPTSLPKAARTAPSSNCCGKLYRNYRGVTVVASRVDTTATTE